MTWRPPGSVNEVIVELNEIKYATYEYIKYEYEPYEPTLRGDKAYK